MKKIPIPGILLLMLYCITAGAQQGPQYSQFMFNNLAINPAYAGADEHLSMTAIARQQWAGIDNAPSTQTFAAHALFFSRVGLGLNVMHDNIGVHDNLNIKTSYAYHLRAGKKAFLSMGLEGGVTVFKSNYPSLAGTSNDPLLKNYVKDVRPSVGAGIYFRSARLDAGLSAPGLLTYKIQLNDTVVSKFRNADVLGYLRYRIPLGVNFVLEPSMLIKYFPKLPLSFDTNVMLSYKKLIYAGVSYRDNESIDGILKLQMTSKLQVGYAYDYPMRYGTYLNSASHELMIHYLLKRTSKKVVSPR